jgi:hypothetical protein
VTGPADDFAQLVENSWVIVDKSMFNKAIFEHSPTTGPSTVLIALPPGTGKTMLLTMFKDFSDNRPVEPLEEAKHAVFRMTFDGRSAPNRHFFKKIDLLSLFCSRSFKIMKEKEFVNKHMGKHPVLFLSFSGMTGNANVLIGKAIRDLFRPNNYLLKWVQRRVCCRLCLT